MTLYTSYGYILIAKNIYDLKSFKKENHKAFQAILNFQSNSPRGDSSMTFEYDDNHRILIPFTIFGETSIERDKVYNNALAIVKKFFPSCKVLLKINLKDDYSNNQTFFNDTTYDYLNDWGILND